MTQYFQSSVANVILRDATTGQAIAHGETLMTSTLKQTMAKTEARGGMGNSLLYTYFHDRAVSFTIKMPVFNEYVLALQSGASVVTGSVTCVQTDTIVFSNNQATLSTTPVAGGNVTVIFDDNDSSVLVTPSGTSITVAGGANRKAKAFYDYTTTADRITVAGVTQPSVATLVLTAPVYNQTQTSVVEYFQLVVPSFKVDGNYTLNMTSNAISDQELNGIALLIPATTASGSDYYYTATYITVSGTSAPYTFIAATPSPVSFIALSGSGTQQLSMLGYRGGIYTNDNITSKCTYTVTSGCSTIFTAGSATGLITAGSAIVAGYSALLNIAYYDSSSGSLTDVVQIKAV